MHTFYFKQACFWVWVTAFPAVSEHQILLEIAIFKKVILHCSQGSYLFTCRQILMGEVSMRTIPSDPLTA